MSDKNEPIREWHWSYTIGGILALCLWTYHLIQYLETH